MASRKTMCEIELEPPVDRGSADESAPSLGSSAEEFGAHTTSLSSPHAVEQPATRPTSVTEPTITPSISLHQAVCDNSIEMVQKWIDFWTGKGDDVKTKLDEKDADDLAAVHYAARYNHYSILMMLYKNGADVTLATTKEWYTPLHYAAYYRPRYQEELTGTMELKSYLTSSSNTVQYLVNIPNLKVCAKDKYSVTPLHLACRRGNTDAAKILLSKIESFEIDSLKDSNGDTPLHEACLCNSDVIVNELLERIKITGKSAPSMLKSLQNNELRTPLHFACQEGHKGVVRRLLEEPKFSSELKKMLLQAPDREGNTVFHLAVKSLRFGGREEVEILELLRENGADPKAERIIPDDPKAGDIKGDRVTPLHIAASYGLIRVINCLIDEYKVDPNVVDVYHRTPLHFAAMHNQPRAVSALLKKKADIKMTDVNSCDAFLLAAANGYHNVVAKLEDCKDFAVDVLDKNGRSAVFLAAEGAHFTLLKHLLATHRRDIKSVCGSVIPEGSIHYTCRKLCSTPDIHLNTPLHIAAKCGHLNIVEELLRDELIKQGHVRLDAKNVSKRTPAHLAAENGCIKVLERLIEKTNSLILDKDEDGNTPLHIAAGGGWKHSVRLLTDRKSDIDASNSNLATPLSLAAGAGHLPVIKSLLQSKADIDARDKRQAPPLHYAVSGGHIEVVKMLIGSGAKCSLKDSDGKNALDLAIDSGHEDVARVIIHSNQWEDALKNTTLEKDRATTPFRKMITKMPDVAWVVLNKCTKRSKGENGEGETIYTYHYVEDVREPCQHRSTIADKRPFKWANSLYLRWISYHFEHDSEDYCNNWGPEKFSKSRHPLSIMAKLKDNKLISHPLVISLLMFKLRKYATFYYLVHLFFHLVFLIFLTTFALLVYNPNSKTCQVVFSGRFGELNIVEDGNNNTGENISDICPSDEKFHNKSLQALCGSCGNVHRLHATQASAVIVIITAIIRFFLFKLFSITQNPRKKLTKSLTWLEVLLFVLSIIFVSVFGTDCLCPTNWQWQVGTVAVLMVWCDLIIFIRKLQVFDIGIYVLMFERVIKSFAHAILLSFLLLIAYSLSFYMAFFEPGVSSTPLSSPGLSILSVLTYVTGGADYNGLFSLSHDDVIDEERREIPFFPVSVILWIIFVVIMTVLLVNFLIGLAVDDIQAIKRAAKVHRLKLLVDLTLTVDSGLPYRHLFVVPKRKVKDKETGLWKKCNRFLWKGEIVQDTPKRISKALNNQSEPTIEQIHVHTLALVKEMASMRETINKLNNRNRQMEDVLKHVTAMLDSQNDTPYS